MLRKLVCRIRTHNLVFEVNWERMVGRYRCTRCGITSPDYAVVSE